MSTLLEPKKRHHAATPPREQTVPLVVDLDGTLLDSDLLVESAIGLLGRNPIMLIRLAYWLVGGKANLKSRLANAVDLDIANLPFNNALIERLKHERESGRAIYLATASHHKYGEAIAKNLDLFDDCFCTTPACNLSSHRKRDLLLERFGHKQFDYVGNSKDDLAVWESAREAWVVNPEAGVEQKARKLGNVTHTINNRPPYLPTLADVMRVRQWTWNLLVFVPLLLWSQSAKPALLLDGISAFLLFGLCASGGYLLNDLMDMEKNRKHGPVRPIAAGMYPVKHTLLLVPGLLGTSLLLAWLMLPLAFTAVLLCYLILTLTYSDTLTHHALPGPVALSFLCGARLAAGSALI